jgi:Glycosyl hydrolases family 6
VHGCRDTSRSGWKAVNNGAPTDKRKARGNWCNVNGAGLGEPPRASPVATLPIDVSCSCKAHHSLLLGAKRAKHSVALNAQPALRH